MNRKRNSGRPLLKETGTTKYGHKTTLLVWRPLISNEAALTSKTHHGCLSGCLFFFLPLSSCVALLLTYIQYHVLFVAYLCNQSNVSLAEHTSVCQSIWSEARS